jgi:ABC-2 type transport system ATP-binding protein
MAHLKDDDGPDLQRRIRAWLERVDLGSVEHKRCEELSKGMQQKVQFLTAVIHRPALVILDEPFSGLDPVNQRLLRELVDEEHRRGATVLFSTHIMVHAEQLCDHVVMIHRGDKVLDDEIGEIRARHDPRNLLFEPLDPASDVASLARLPGIEAIRKDGTAWDITLARGASPATVIQQVAAAIPPARVELRRPSLEDVFIGIVRAESAEGDDTTLRAAVRDGGDGRREARR